MDCGLIVSTMRYRYCYRLKTWMISEGGARNALQRRQSGNRGLHEKQAGITVDLLAQLKAVTLGWSTGTSHQLQ